MRQINPKTTRLAVLVLMICLARDVQAQVSSQRREVVNVPTEALAGLSHGMTELQVVDALGARGIHQFTALRSNSIIRCKAYYRSEMFGKYYVVFTNNHLLAICEPPPFKMQLVSYQGSWSNRRVLGNPEERIAQVLDASDIIGSALFAKLKPSTRTKRSWDPGLTAAYLLTRKLFADKKREAEREAAYTALLDRYDPIGIDLGATVEMIEARLGTSHITQALEMDREMRYYGSIEYGLTGNRELMWLAIVYDKGKVIRVFSDDFIDHEKIRAIEDSGNGSTPHQSTNEF